MEEQAYAFVEIVNRSPKRNMDEPHHHNKYEVYFFLGEEMTYFLNALPVKLRTDDIVLVDAFVDHRTSYSYPKKTNERANLSFNAAFLEKYFSPDLAEKIKQLFLTPFLLGHPQAGGPLREMLKPMCAHFAESSPFSYEIGCHELCIFLLRLLGCGPEFQKIQSAEGLFPKQSRILQIASFINGAYNKDITLQSLAEKFFVSKYYLSHAFKQTLGVGVTDYINRKRVNESVFFLRRRDITLTEIAYQVGFNSQNHFIRMFKRYFGATPGAYRRLAQDRIDETEFFRNGNA